MINKKLKLISVLISSAILSMSLSGCENASNKADYGLDAKNPTTINIWHYYNGVQQTSFDKMINEFNETVGYEKGIIIEATSVGSVDELSEKVLSSLNN